MMVATKHLDDILAGVPDRARIWIYQCNRELSDAEVLSVESAATQFVKQWNTHGSRMSARALVLYRRFLILIADESQVAASGCSIDSSVHFVQTLEKNLGVSFFDRLLITWRDETGTIRATPMNEFQEMINLGKISESQIVFNNLISTVEELKSNWETKALHSWHARLFN